MFAQSSERSTISGAVTDSTAAVVPAHKDHSDEPGDQQRRHHDDQQRRRLLRLPQLPPGQYNVRGDKEGFKPALVTNVTVNTGANPRIDITLEVGSAQQAIEVQASAVSLQTEDAKASTTITNKLVDELPLVVGGALRSPFDLAQLTPEAKSRRDDDFMLGGGQAASYGAVLDGVSANITRAQTVSWVAVNAPSVEAITEFTVDTNGFKAEYGHAGGGTMSFTSKSGTNDFHGSVYEFLRNDALDANRFFSTSSTSLKLSTNSTISAWPPAVRSSFPSWSPGKSKDFFFASYKGLRNRKGATATSATVPTAEMYNGDFADGSIPQASRFRSTIRRQRRRTRPAGPASHVNSFPGT